MPTRRIRPLSDLLSSHRVIMAEENNDLENSEPNDKFSEKSTPVIESPHRDLGIGKVRSESTVSIAMAAPSASEEDELPSIAHVATSNSVPSVILSHPGLGADLEKGPTGPANRTLDGQGKIVVNWISRTDPENPKNWPRKKKIYNVVIISAMTFLCPLCSAMFVCWPQSH